MNEQEISDKCKQEEEELSELIPLAMSGELISTCMYCQNLINQKTKKAIELSDYQKGYVRGKYSNKITSGIDMDCYNKYTKHKELDLEFK